MYVYWVVALYVKQRDSSHQIVSSLNFGIRWSNAGWHSPDDPQVTTPALDALLKQGIELDRMYAYKVNAKLMKDCTHYTRLQMGVDDFDVVLVRIVQTSLCARSLVLFSDPVVHSFGSTACARDAVLQL